MSIHLIEIGRLQARTVHILTALTAAVEEGIAQHGPSGLTVMPLPQGHPGPAQIYVTMGGRIIGTEFLQAERAAAEALAARVNAALSPLRDAYSAETTAAIHQLSDGATPAAPT